MESGGKNSKMSCWFCRESCVSQDEEAGFFFPNVLFTCPKVAPKKQLMSAELEYATFGKRAEYAVYVSCVELGIYWRNSGIIARM